MSEVSNDTIYGALMGIKEDIGGLKEGQKLHLKALENFGPRIGALETAAAKQRGAARVWGIVATGVATVVAALIEVWRPHH